MIKKTDHEKLIRLIEQTIIMIQVGTVIVQVCTVLLVLVGIYMASWLLHDF